MQTVSKIIRRQTINAFGSNANVCPIEEFEEFSYPYSTRRAVKVPQAYIQFFNILKQGTQETLCEMQYSRPIADPEFSDSSSLHRITQTQLPDWAGCMYPQLRIGVKWQRDDVSCLVSALIIE